MNSMRVMIFFGLLLISKFAYANLDSALEKTIHSEVYRQCSSSEQNLEHGLAFVQAMQSSYKAFNDVTSFQTTAAMQLYRDRGLTPTTSAILDSMALHKALNDCYGDDSNLKNRFVMKMIAADLMGRVVGASQGTLTFILFGKFFSFIVKKSYGILLLTPFGKKLNPANATYHLAGIGGVLITGLVSPMLMDLYRKKQALDLQETADRKEYEEILLLAHKEMERVQKSEVNICDKAAEAFQVALIIQDTYKTLKNYKGAENTLKRFEALYTYSLSVKACD